MMHHSAKDNYVHLTTTPVPRLITSLAVPTIISMLVTSFYNMADTYFVGKINMGHRTKRILRIERKEYQTY